jgi:hypothetical protein
MVKDSGAPQGAHRIVPVNVPAPVAVACDKAGAPIAVGERPIVGIQSVWRIDDEWWRDRPISRMYYSLLMDDGRLLTVFKDLLLEEWYAQHY